MASRSSLISLLALATPALALRVQPAARTEHLDRRTLLTAVTNLGAATLVTVPRGVLAEVKGPNANMPRDERGVNDVLRGAGFPPMKVVNGLKPLVQYVGFASPANIDGQKARDRPYKGTLLVRFLYPSSWIVETPTITENGEAGKIAANNYQKGDLAEFVALTLPNGKRLGDLGADFYKGWLSSQMSSDVYEDVKIKKITPVTQPDGAEVAYIDFRYTLLTRAGFEVVRKGMASAQVASGAVVGLVIATTEQRYKGLEDDIRASVDSFRAYPVKLDDPLLASM